MALRLVTVTIITARVWVRIRVRFRVSFSIICCYPQYIGEHRYFWCILLFTAARVPTLGTRAARTRVPTVRLAAVVVPAETAAIAAVAGPCSRERPTSLSQAIKSDLPRITTTFHRIDLYNVIQTNKGVQQTHAKW